MRPYFFLIESPHGLMPSLLAAEYGAKIYAGTGLVNLLNPLVICLVEHLRVLASLHLTSLGQRCLWLALKTWPGHEQPGKEQAERE